MVVTPIEIYRYSYFLEYTLQNKHVASILIKYMVKIEIYREYKHAFIMLNLFEDNVNNETNSVFINSFKMCFAFRFKTSRTKSSYTGSLPGKDCLMNRM